MPQGTDKSSTAILSVTADIRTLISSLPTSAMVMDISGRVVFVNDMCAEMFGCAEEELIGKDFFSVSFAVQQGVEQAENEDTLVDLAAAGKAQVFEWTHSRDDGSEFHAEVSLSRLMVGEATLVLALLYDMTERFETENVLLEVLQTSDDIVRAIPSGLIIYQYEEPDRLILLHGNPEAERLTGVPVEDCKGLDFDEMWPGTRDTDLKLNLLDVVKTGQRYESERFH